jgi:hypothetical protein
MTRPKRHPLVHTLVGLLYGTAIATAAVEGLNWWYTEDGGWGLFVRTAWGVVRALGFLIVVWHVRRGRASAPPLGLVLAVTNVFAVARLVVPKSGYPALPGIIGFAVITVLCLTIVALLYRPTTMRSYLSQPHNRIQITARGIEWGPADSARPRPPGWRLTTRVAALSYSPLMAVGALVAFGEVPRRPVILPLVIAWLAVALLSANATAFTTVFMLRGKAWARRLLVVLTMIVLAIQLPLCWILLGVDGLIRDGGPLAVCGLVALIGLWRGASSRSGDAVPV